MGPNPVDREAAPRLVEGQRVTQGQSPQKSARPLAHLPSRGSPEDVERVVDVHGHAKVLRGRQGGSGPPEERRIPAPHRGRGRRAKHQDEEVVVHAPDGRDGELVLVGLDRDLVEGVRDIRAEEGDGPGPVGRRKVRDVLRDVEELREDDPLALADQRVHEGPAEVPDDAVLQGAIRLLLGDEGEPVDRRGAGPHRGPEVGPGRNPLGPALLHHAVEEGGAHLGVVFRRSVIRPPLGSAAMPWISASEAGGRSCTAGKTPEGSRRCRTPRAPLSQASPREFRRDRPPPGSSRG